MWDVERELAEHYQMESEVSLDLEILKNDFDNGIIDLDCYQDEKDFLEERLQTIQEDIFNLEKEIEGEL